MRSHNPGPLEHQRLFRESVVGMGSSRHPEWNRRVISVSLSVWQCVDSEQVTGSFTLLWNRTNLSSSDGRFILTSSDGQEFVTSNETVFNGDITYVAAGLSGSMPFVELRVVDRDEISLSASYAGATVFSGVFTGSN